MEVKNKDYGYGLALKIAREELAHTDIAGQCRRSGAQYLPNQKAIAVEFASQPYQISLPGGEVTVAGREAPVPEKILVLHYFLQAKDVPLTNDLISFKELPEGSGYYPTFYARAIKPLVKQFGHEPRRLAEVAAILGGRPASYGDVSVTIDGFRKVPVTLVLWRGDDEFPPEGNILLDSSISHYLPAEDIIFLCQTITWRLVKASGEPVQKL
jgi:hypothetical protein